ncbi:MAG TPA: VOC family protein [Opitutaceae bacterium]|jgi:predicted enzyme related to lactoylglutathione lyase|nr:VOC family protein [Opitutaceae bacterium]
MKVKDIAFVIYAVSGLKQARPFYEETLGLKPTKTYVAPDGDMGMVEYDVGPATIAIGCGAPAFQPGKGGTSNVVAALEVEDFPAAVARLKEKGAKFRMEPMEHPSCHMALIEDPDGNPIMIHRRK